MKPRILLVDDDVALRSSLGRALRRDYDVTLASDGAEALALVEADAAFDVVISDVEMPQMNGRELFGRLVALDATLAARIIVMTAGPTAPDLAAWVDALPRGRVVRKPLGLDGFLAAIRAVLGSPG